MVPSYHKQQQQVISSEVQQPINMTPASYSATQSDPPSSLSSNKSATATSASAGGGKRVRVLDASGQDVQVHAGFDDMDAGPLERSSVQQTQSQPAPRSATAQQPTAASINAYSDLEDIMASMSEFDVSYQELSNISI